MKTMSGTVASQPARKQRAWKPSPIPSLPSTRTERKDPCAAGTATAVSGTVAAYPVRMPRATPGSAPPDGSITQITQVPLCPHLQLHSVHGQKICLSSWDTDSRIRDCSSPKVVPSACQAKTLGRNLILDNIIMHKESLRPVLPHTLTKGLSSIQFSFTYSITHLPKRSSLPHFGKRKVFLCLPNLREIYFSELPLAFLLSWPFANLSAEKQPSWLCRTDGDKVTSNVPFLGHSLLQQHQTCLQSANLGKTLQSKRCPVALSRLMWCHS